MMMTTTMAARQRKEMTMNRHFVLRVGVFAGLLATFCGCDKGPSLSEIEARERTSRMYTNATDDLQAGRMDAAIKGFERVVLKEPESYSAHFQLAPSGCAQRLHWRHRALSELSGASPGLG